MQHLEEGATHVRDQHEKDKSNNSTQRENEQDDASRLDNASHKALAWSFCSRLQFRGLL